MSALEAVTRVVREGSDADEVLRAVVATLATEGGCDWAGILFVEDGELILGPESGTQRPAARTQHPVEFQGERIAELVTDGSPDAALPEQVAALVAEWCLVGWDTGGVPWDPAA